MSETTTQLGKMSAQGQPLVFNERRGNPNTTGQNVTGPKTSLNIGTDALYTKVT